MTDTILSQFLAQIGSELTDFKRFDIPMRDTIIDGNGDEELQNLSDRLGWNLTGQQSRAALKQAARNIDSQQQITSPVRTQREDENEYPEEDRQRRKHRFEKFKNEDKATSEEKRRVQEMLDRTSGGSSSGTGEGGNGREDATRLVSTSASSIRGRSGEQ
jgi:hypothetical protein